MKNTKNQILVLLTLLTFLSCNNDNKRNSNKSNAPVTVEENTNLNLQKDDTKLYDTSLANKKVIDFAHISGMLDSEPTLSGEFMSKLDLNKFQIFTIKVTNKNGIEDDEKIRIIDILGYENLKGCHANEPNYNKRLSNEPDILESKNRFEFMDSSGFCVKTIDFYDNIFDKQPECTYQILSVRKFIYEKEKENIPFQLVYPERLLRLCK
ncbi:hypothetical protein KBJ98_09680 [Flavobacterium sp. F-328]|uniref:Lipoprotein n=1 Tax=Flavobacterium erciyesense TaxID=2825842 RepID=A0ABS5D4L5_9FLAO|nr:hypothetical protein [Flavobacterium erciyesense]MBQ0908970.1 hypothetical protein [Flavobacterium erciyesense]